jgi:hypothetical protein
MTADPDRGCRLCGAEWGDYRANVQGEELRFCCDACASFYRLAVEELCRRTGWPRVDRLFLESVRGTEGDGWARHGEELRELHVRGTPDGEVLEELTIRPRTRGGAP